MFDVSRCDYCGDCLSMCYYLDVDKKDSGREFKKLVNGEKVNWLHDCITCFACNEYCSKKARPFDLIIKRMEEDGTYFDTNLLKLVADRFKTDSEPRPVELKEKVISVCVMHGITPQTLQGQLFGDNITILKGRPYFCNVLFLHMGNISILKDRLQKTIDNLALSGAEEIVFFHEDCYALLKGIAPYYGFKVPFKVVHLFEYLRDYLRAHSDQITKLNMKIAYQRPCASRFTPGEIEGALDEIFDLIGVERVARQYDRLNALCCGADAAIPGLKQEARENRLKPFRDKNIKDAIENDAEAIAYLCPMCFRALHQQASAANLKNYMVSDLCRLALNETLPEGQL